MSVLNNVKAVLLNTLNLDKDKITLVETTYLLGNIPELDSMGVINVTTAIEEYFDIRIEDDEINAENFESVASLVSLVNKKLDV